MHGFVDGFGRRAGITVFRRLGDASSFLRGGARDVEQDYQRVGVQLP